MRKLAILLIFVPLLALVFASAVHGETLMASKDGLKKALAGTAKVGKVTLEPTPEEKKKLKDGWNVEDASATFYLGKAADGTTQKVAILITEPGKEGPITAVIAMTPDGKIEEMILLEFSEERGKPAKEASFLAQFKGKDHTHAFKLGKDCDGVAGATWTSTTMATICRRAAALYKVLVLDRAPAK